MLTDVNIQQATMNLLADMQCHPLTPNPPTLRRIDVALVDEDKGSDKDKDRGSDKEKETDIDITAPTSTLLFPVISPANTDRKGVPHSAAAITHPLNGPVYIAKVATQFNPTQSDPTQLNPSIV